MKIENLDFADGRIEKIISNPQDVSIVLLDWKERLWKIVFDYVVAVENFNIEGEDLAYAIVESENSFITLAINASEDKDDGSLPFFCYSFFPRYAQKARLRIVASNCRVTQIQK